LDWYKPTCCFEFLICLLRPPPTSGAGKSQFAALRDSGRLAHEGIGEAIKLIRTILSYKSQFAMRRYTEEAEMGPPLPIPELLATKRARPRLLKGTG